MPKKGQENKGVFVVSRFPSIFRMTFGKEVMSRLNAQEGGGEQGRICCKPLPQLILYDFWRKRDVQEVGFIERRYVLLKLVGKNSTSIEKSVCF